MSPRILTPGTSKPLERVMVFLDGAYLRQLCKQHCGHERIDFRAFSTDLIRAFNSFGTPFFANLIRIYYYDAIVAKEHPKYEEQRRYFDNLRKKQQYTVRLGSLVESSKGEFKQKGVDVWMAVDSLTKAYQQHYETAIFFAGDGDFVPLIEAVKDAGKKTFLACNPETVSPELTKSADMCLYFRKDKIKDWME